MGRRQYSVILAEQRALYAVILKYGEGTAEADEFRAPTLDPSVAWARHVAEPGNTQRAVTELPPSRPTSPTTPVFAPITPPRSPVSLPMAIHVQHTTHTTTDRLSSPFRLDSANQDRVSRIGPTRLPYLNIPVILADCIVGAPRIIPRFAVLGPHLPGMLWRDKIIQLTGDDSATVILRRNHGSSPQKPWCTILETAFLTDDFPNPRIRILLAANFLVHGTFEEELDPDQQFVGDMSGLSMQDWMDVRTMGPNYGVSHVNYRRADSLNEGETNNETGDDEELTEIDAYSSP